MNETAEIFDDISNPLDSVEDMLAGQDWVFDRPNPEELSLAVQGSAGAYRITFVWQEDCSAMQFFCEFDMAVPDARRDAVARALQSINPRLWLGHFILQDGSNVPCFRHTSLFRGWTHTSGTEHVEDLIDIALAECERYRSAFAILSGPAADDDTLLGLALSDVAGNA